MQNIEIQKQFEVEQYNNQANLVYLNTIIICALLIGVFWLWIGSVFVAVLQAIAVVISSLAMWLNRKHHYYVASLIYISLITAISVSEILVFGLKPGFQYFFFNLAGLIMFTNWRPWQKAAGVVIETGLLIAVFLVMVGKVPPTQMSDGQAAFFHVLNVILNVAGVANSANYYISIATKAHKRINILAMKDYLTNLLNRTSFDASMEHFAETRNQMKIGMAVLLIDIDHFKNINDSYGHLCGDELLRQFAVLLSKSSRTEDLAARYGGEEFVIVAFLESQDKMHDLAERLRRDVESMLFEYHDLTLQITCSIGALFIPPTAQIDRSQAIDLADKLLYRAKAEGRNRVVTETYR